MFVESGLDGLGRPGRRAAWLREAGATLRLAWPLVLGNLAATSLATVDVVLLGRIGPAALAAAALGATLYHAAFLACLGLVTAVSPLVAQEYGRRRHSVREIRRTVRQGLWVAVSISGPVMAALSFGEPILVALGQEPALARGAARYIGALQFALLPTLVSLVLRLFMASVGRPGWGLAVSLAAVPVNYGLARLMIFGGIGLPPLGLPGAGLATALTMGLSVAALALVLSRDRRFRRYHLFGRFWRPDWPRFLAIWRIGLPIAATIGLETGLFTATGLFMGTIGPTALAAHTIALQIASLCFMVPLGLGQAATIRVGQAVGAADPAGVSRAGWTAFAMALAFTAATATLLLAVPTALIGAFVDTAANPDLVRLGVAFLGIAALFQLADGAQAVGSGMLRGLGDTRVPMVYAAFGYWAVGAPLGFLLGQPERLGGAGVWAGLAGGLTATAGLMLWRWTRRDRLSGAAPPAGTALPGGRA